MASSNVRAPSAQVLVDGSLLPNLIDAQIVSNSHYAAARFRVRAALGPADLSNFSTPGESAEIRLSLNTDAVSVLIGMVDSLMLDPIRGIVEMHGRDNTALLIEARTAETFSNQTASDVASTLAARHGLAADVVATATRIGRYYQSRYDGLTLDQFCQTTTEWDLLTALAQYEGFDVWVDGLTLHFKPASAREPIAIRPADCISIRLERALTLARDIQVTVKSWSSRQQSTVNQSVRAARTGAQGQRDMTVQHYVYVRPNLAEAEALSLAKRLLSQISEHERTVLLTMPGELDITTRSVIALQATQTDFDQSYAVAEIDRQLDMKRGYIQTLRLKNTPTVTRGI